MKKILLSILLSLVLKEGVSAKAYYSDYSEFSNYSLEEKQSTDLVNVEVKKVYNKYFSVAEGDYYRLDENPVWLPYINVNIYKDTDFTVWSTIYPLDKLGRIIESRSICDNNDCTTNHFEYRYKDRLYFHYRKTEKLLDKNSSLKGYIKDENDYTIHYRYQTRDKIDISDNITIIDKNTRIEDFIFSTVPYEIVGNIDYSKNDIYLVNVVTDFITIPLQIKVLVIDNINDNYNKELFDKRLSIEKLNKIVEIKTKQIELLKSNINNQNKTNFELKEKNILLEQTVKKISEENSINQDLLVNCKNINNNYKLELLKFNEDFINYKKEISNLKSNLSIKIIDNNNKSNTINNLNSKIEEYELKLIKGDDNLKKLDLCNKSIKSLEQKTNNSESIKKQNITYVLFISIIFFFILCSVLKIKSIKKNN